MVFPSVFQLKPRGPLEADRGTSSERANVVDLNDFQHETYNRTGTVTLTLFNPVLWSHSFLCSLATVCLYQSADGDVAPVETWREAADSEASLGFLSFLGFCLRSITTSRQKSVLTLSSEFSGRLCVYITRCQYRHTHTHTHHSHYSLRAKVK